MNTENSSVLGEESEDDFDWEEVEVGQQAVNADALQAGLPESTSIEDYYGKTHGLEEGPSERQHIEVTIKTQGKAKGDQKYAAVACVLSHGL